MLKYQNYNNVIINEFLSSFKLKLLKYFSFACPYLIDMFYDNMFMN